VQVYVDESERRDYLLCAVLVRSDVGRVRRAVRAMCQPGQRRVHEEPLLWVPDAIAWAVGRGGDWRRRAEPLLDKVVDLGP
jgi:hypothetical protein